MRTSGGILVRRIRTIKKRLREPVNGLTHAAGGVLAFVGLFVLQAKAASAGSTAFVSFVDTTLLAYWRKL